MIFGVIVSNILAYIFHIYVGRALGPAEYGVFGALMSLFLIIALPAGAISSAITKFSARLYSRKEYSKIGILRKKIALRVWIYSGLLFLIILLLSPYIAAYLKIDSIVPVAIIGFTLIFSMILPVNRGILQGMKKFNAYSWNTIIESVSRLLIVILFLILGYKTNGALLAYGLGYLISYVLIFPLIKETKPDLKKESGKIGNIEMKSIYRFIILVLIVNLILQLIINLPTVFIKHFFSSEFTGYWTAALTLARITLFVSSGITLVMFSEVAGITEGTGKTSEEKSNKKIKDLKNLIFKKALLMTLLSSILMAIIFLIVPDVLISILYGQSFAGAIPILKWMGIAMIFISLLQLWLNYWLADR